MTDVHCHVACGDGSVREFVIGRDFVGVHPWDAETTDAPSALAALRARLESDSACGVGEIGLDRLKTRDVSAAMRVLFEEQLRLAAAYCRPVVLHGAKCWGQVVETIRRLFPKPHAAIPSFLFHGFSRSDGLLPDIYRMNGFVSIGPAILNDHAVNYRALARKIASPHLLVETDRTEQTAADGPTVGQIAAKLADVRGVRVDELVAVLDANAERFRKGLPA